MRLRGLKHIPLRLPGIVKPKFVTRITPTNKPRNFLLQTPPTPGTSSARTAHRKLSITLPAKEDSLTNPYAYLAVLMPSLIGQNRHLLKPGVGLAQV